MRISKEQPCWTCAKACGGCSWSAKLQPIPGWIAKERRYSFPTKYSMAHVKHTGSSYEIEYCPEYEEKKRDG